MPRKNNQLEEIIKQLLLDEKYLGRAKPSNKPVINLGLPSRVIIIGAMNPMIC